MSLGKFVTFEGGEGAGKSTQALLLQRTLSRLRVPADVTREPGGTPLAEAVRAVLLDAGLSQRSPSSELLLFYAARADHLQRRILPALHAGSWVICDRFNDSTRAYQGSLDQNQRALLEALERHVVGSNLPDLTVILDVDPEVGMRRAIRRTYDAGGRSPLLVTDQLAFSFAPDRFEALDIEFHRRVRTAFLEIARAEPHRCVVIDSGGGIHRVAELVWEAISERFSASLPNATTVI
jgi:dTMP kinase